MKIPRSLPDPARISERLLERLSIDNPPTPLERIIGFWRELSLVEEDLDGSGYLLSLGALGAEILVNRNDPEERKRFTIAHELGHWVLYLIGQRTLAKCVEPSRGTHDAVEKWCDAFATNLLMPAAALRLSLPNREDPLFINAVLQGPARFGVSKQAFFIRVWEILRVQVAVLRATRRSGSGSMFIEGNHADRRHERKLLELLDAPSARHQMEIAGEVVSFAVRSPEGVTSVSGRRIGDGRFVIAVAWPISGSVLGK